MGTRQQQHGAQHAAGDEKRSTGCLVSLETMAWLSGMQERHPCGTARSEPKRVSAGHRWWQWLAAGAGGVCVCVLGSGPACRVRKLQ